MIWATIGLLGLAGTVPAQLVELDGLVGYQGVLSTGGLPAEGEFAVVFRLWDSEFGGDPASTELLRTFTLRPGDRGAFSFNDLRFDERAFGGADRWLELTVWEETVAANGVLDAGESAFALPRQPIVAAPTATYATRSADGLDDAFRNGRVIRNDGQLPAVVEGPLHVGAVDTSGSLTVYDSAVAGPIAQIGGFGPEGGFARIIDENGASLVTVEPDLAGNGAFMQLAGDAAFLRWDGDVGGGPNSGGQLIVQGAASSTAIRPYLSGDDSVALPDDAVSSAERLDEPGIASTSTNVSGSLEVPATYAAIRTASITAPADGFVIATADVQVRRDDSGGSLRTEIEYGISTSPTSVPFTEVYRYTIASDTLGDFLGIPLGAHSVFPVAAGQHTFHLVMRSNIEGYPMEHTNGRLTLMYVPTAYGPVNASP